MTKNNLIRSTAIIATALSAQASLACEPECLEGKAGEKGSLEARNAAAIDLIDERIGANLQLGVVSMPEMQSVLAQQKQLRDAFQKARADGKISAAESKDLLQRRREIGDALIAKIYSLPSLQKRLASFQDRINGGLAHGDITPTEKAALQAKLDALKNEVSAKAAGGLSVAEQRELAKKLATLSKEIYNDRRDAEGAKLPSPNREGDTVDERQRNQAGILVRCLNQERITPSAFDRLMRQQEGIREKEQLYLKDGKLDKEERDDLSQLLAQAATSIRNQCRTATKSSAGTPLNGGFVNTAR